MLIGLVSVSFICVVQAYFLVRLARAVFNFEDKIEVALDKIDESYGVIGEILERPLFYDSPEVREVHNQIGTVNAYLLSVASDLAVVETEHEEEE